MKFLTLLLASLFCFSLGATAQPPVEVERLRSAVGRVFDNEYFAITDYEMGVAEKRLTGRAVLFKRQEIDFAATYDSDGSIGAVTLSFPEKNGLGVSNAAWQRLAGARLAPYVPKELERSVRIKETSFWVNRRDSTQIDSLSLTFSTLQRWDMLAGDAFALHDLLITFDVERPTDKQRRKTRATLTGNTRIGALPVVLSAQLQPQREDLELSGRIGGLQLKRTLTDLCGADSFRGIDLPTAVVDLTLEDGLLTVAPYRKWASIDAATDWGRANVFLQVPKKKQKGRKLDYVVAITTADDFRLSRLNDRLAMLDRLSLGGQRIVLSSAKRDKKSTAQVPSLAQVKSGIQRGCSYLADLDLQALRLDKLLRTTRLTVATQLNSRLDGITLAGALDTDLEFGPSARLTGVEFRLTPAPKDFAVALVGIMDTRVNDDALTFTGGVELGISDQSLGFLALMEGEWNEPLGTRGLTLRNVGIQLGASFTAAPVILPQVGFTGDLGIGRFNGAATLFCDTRNPGNTMISASFNELPLDQLVGAVLTGGVARRLPKPLLKTLGEMGFSDVKVEVVPLPVTVLERHYDQGFRMNGAVSIMGWNGRAELDIDPESRLYGSGEMDPLNFPAFKLTGANGKPRPSLLIDVNARQPRVAANGTVSLLGVTAATDITFAGDDFSFLLSGRAFGKFAASIRATGRNLARVEALALEVKMKNDLLGYLTEQATNSINAATAESQKNIRKYRNLVAVAQREVDGWDRQVADVKRIVEADQAADLRKVRAHEAKVNAAQREVNRLNGVIKSKNRELAAAKGIRNMAKRASLRTQIAALWVSHKAATGSLVAYKATLVNFLKTVNTNPWTDPRLVGLKASQETARGVLAGHQQQLRLLETTLGLTGTVATFIVENGAKALLNVREADFRGQLGSVAGGKVSLRAKMEWMNKEKTVNFAFDFNNAKAGVERLVDELLDR